MTTVSDIIHVGDVGTVFSLTITDADGIAVNLSTALVKRIFFKKPSQERVCKSAVFATDGTNGKIEYTTVDGDIDESGAWQLQGYVEFSDMKLYTEKTSFSVQSNISTDCS